MFPQNTIDWPGVLFGMVVLAMGAFAVWIGIVTVNFLLAVGSGWGPLVLMRLSVFYGLVFFGFGAWFVMVSITNE